MKPSAGTSSGLLSTLFLVFVSSLALLSGLTSAAAAAAGEPTTLATSKIRSQPQTSAGGRAAGLCSGRIEPSSDDKAGRAARSSLAEPSGAESNIANAEVQVSPRDMAAAAGHHYGKSHHGKYYMYTEVPKKHTFKMGYKRGNHKHTIEGKESRHKSHVHSHFKWHDKKGKGSHKFEFKHKDHKKKHYHW